MIEGMWPIPIERSILPGDAMYHAGQPAIAVDRTVSEHLEILCPVSVCSTFIFSSIQHTYAIKWFLALRIVALVIGGFVCRVALGYIKLSRAAKNVDSALGGSLV